MSQRLIINGDDYGYDEGVVRAINQAHQAGVLSSLTALVNMPAWPQGAAYLRAHPELGAGVHLVFNDGPSVLPREQVPTLIAADGNFHGDKSLMGNASSLSVAELKAEFRAQIERFIADTGHRPTHLDNHCPISYVRADWFTVAVELAAEYALPMRMPFDDALEQKAPGMAQREGFPVELVLAQGQMYREMLAARSIPSPNYFEMGFSSEEGRTLDNLLHLLDTLPEGVTELLTHPGYDGDWREQEIEILLDPRVRARLDELGLSLISYADLKR